MTYICFVLLIMVLSSTVYLLSANIFVSIVSSFLGVNFWKCLEIWARLLVFLTKAFVWIVSVFPGRHKNNALEYLKHSH
jgi:hypothetical protein